MLGFIRVTMLINIIRLAVAVATFALLSSIPAAGQATKLSPQQLNSPTLSVNKPIAAPKAYSPNLNKPIAAPTASSTFQRPVTNRDMKPRDYSGPNANGPPGVGANLPSNLLGNGNAGYAPCPGGKSPDPQWQLLNLTTKGTDPAKARAIAFEYEVIG
jgi:hypothetical protein